MDDIGDMVGDHLGLDFLDNLRQGAANRGEQGHPRRRRHQQQHPPERPGFGRRRQAGGDRIDY